MNFVSHHYFEFFHQKNHFKIVIKLVKFSFNKFEFRFTSLLWISRTFGFPAIKNIDFKLNVAIFFISLQYYAQYESSRSVECVVFIFLSTSPRSNRMMFAKTRSMSDVRYPMSIVNISDRFRISWLPKKKKFNNENTFQ